MVFVKSKQKNSIFANINVYVDEVQNLVRVNSDCAPKDYEYQQICNSIENDLKVSTLEKTQSSLEIDSNRSNSCPPVGSTKQNSALINGGRGLGKRSSLRKAHSKHNQNPMNMTSYMSNASFSKQNALMSRTKKAKENYQVNAAKIVEQFKKFNFNQDSFNQIVQSNQRKNGRKSKKSTKRPDYMGEDDGNQGEKAQQRRKSTKKAGVI